MTVHSCGPEIATISGLSNTARCPDVNDKYAGETAGLTFGSHPYVIGIIYFPSEITNLSSDQLLSLAFESIGGGHQRQMLPYFLLKTHWIPISYALLCNLNHYFLIKVV